MLLQQKVFRCIQVTGIHPFGVLNQASHASTLMLGLLPPSEPCGWLLGVILQTRSPSLFAYNWLDKRLLGSGVHMVHFSCNLSRLGDGEVLVQVDVGKEACRTTNSQIFERREMPLIMPMFHVFYLVG
jgi:hypothetical protein